MSLNHLRDDNTPGEATALDPVRSIRRRKRRLMEAILKMSSLQQLPKVEVQHPVIQGRTLPRSASCGNLDSPGPFLLKTGSRANIKSAASGTVLDIMDVVEQQTPQAEDRDLFSMLPDELNVRIFSFLRPKELVRASLVCKRWHVLCYDGQLWTTFDASEFYKDIPVEKLAGIIIKAGPFIRHLNLRGCVQIQNYWRVELVSNACQNLLSANLEGCKLERNIVHNFVGTNTSLLQINLSGLISVSNMTCRLLGQKCPRLTSLDISWCSGVDSRGIRKIIENCPELRELKASECGRFDEASPMQAIFKSNSLERLYLSGCESLTDESIRIMVEGRNADIDPLTGRTTAPPRKLKHLDLSRCSRLTSATLKHLAYNVPDLEGLQLSGCEGMTDEGFEALLPTVPKLTHLDLEECTQVSNTTVLALAKAPCAVTLKHLQLSYCEQVGDVGLAPLIRACPNLTNLEIDNTRVGDFTLEEIAIRTRNRKVSSDRLGAFVGLRVVIYDCPSISWHGVREVLVRNAVKVPSRAAHGQVVQIKCYYGWQMTVDEHLKRVLRGDLCSANRLESKWAEHMVAVEEGHGRRRRRRRRGDALWAPEDGDDGDEEGAGAASSWRNGRRRRGASCVVM